MNTHNIRLTLALLALVFIAAACSAPPVSVRRSALAPLATGPVRSGRPLDDGEVRVTFQLDQSLNGPQPDSSARGLLFYDDLVDDYWVPDPEDAGVRIPQTQLGASAYFGITDHFEIGGQASFGPNGNAQANFPAHVIDFDASPSFRIGPGVRGNILATPNFAISFGAEFNIMRVPQATFICRNADRIGDSTDGVPGAPISGWCTSSDEFDLDRVENHAGLYAATMLEPVYMIDEHFSVFAHGGVSTGVQNIGFDPFIARADESTLSTYATPFFGMGAEVRLDHFFVSTGIDFLFPVAPEIGNMPVLSIRMGGRVPGRSDREPQMLE